jgi:hypothetical protein
VLLSPVSLYRARQEAALLKSLFLTYANNPFRDDPDNVFKIYKEIVAALPADDHFSRKGIGDSIFSLVSLFAMADNMENALKQ